MSEAVVGAIHISPRDKIRSKWNEYTVLHKIGQGGFATVYVVQSRGEEYALKLAELWKFMPQERIEYVARFRQEYDLNKQIQLKEKNAQRYIIRSHDYDFFEGNPFIVMDYCSNGTLRSKIGHTWSHTELRMLAINILKALRSLHQEGIIHRDIKPDNILLDKNNLPKLSDFGISASIKKRRTMANPRGLVKEVFATATYSPPEQLDYKLAGKVMGNTNDIFAFGATMYEVITKGQLPYGSYEDFVEDMKAYEKRKVKEQWSRYELEISGVKPIWFQIIEKCLKYRPEDRFQHTDEIIQLLGAPVIGEGDTGTKSSIAINWALRLMNGDEIGRIYFINNLAATSDTYTSLPLHLDEGNRNLVADPSRIRILTIGWYDEQHPFHNDISIVEKFTQYVSKQHATLILNTEANEWYIRDGQYIMLYPNNATSPFGWKPSTNGVLLNSQPIGREFRKLQLYDIIYLGDTTLKVIDANML